MAQKRSLPEAAYNTVVLIDAETKMRPADFHEINN